MREFFKGWRRKVGCVALVMAVAATGLWIRSRSITDHLAFPRPGRQHNVVAVDGLVFWYAADSSDEGWSFESSSLRHSPNLAEHLSHVEEFEDMVVWVKEANFWKWMIPIWTLVWPATLLSAYLILWKPRTKDKLDA